MFRCVLSYGFKPARQKDDTDNYQTIREFPAYIY